jgi:hypothetical protein
MPAFPLDERRRYGRLCVPGLPDCLAFPSLLAHNGAPGLSRTRRPAIARRVRRRRPPELSRNDGRPKEFCSSGAIGHNTRLGIGERDTEVKKTAVADAEYIRTRVNLLDRGIFLVV